MTFHISCDLVPRKLKKKKGTLLNNINVTDGKVGNEGCGVFVWSTPVLQRRDVVGWPSSQLYPITFAFGILTYRESHTRVFSTPFIPRLVSPRSERSVSVFPGGRHFRFPYVASCFDRLFRGLRQLQQKDSVDQMLLG